MMDDAEANELLGKQHNAECNREIGKEHNRRLNLERDAERWRMAKKLFQKLPTDTPGLTGYYRIFLYASKRRPTPEAIIDGHIADEQADEKTEL